MGKIILGAIAAVLVGSGVVVGQTADHLLPAPTPLEAAQKPPQYIAEHKGAPEYFADSAPSTLSLFMVDAEYVLAFFPKKREDTTFATDGGNNLNPFGSPLIATSDHSLDRRPWSGARLSVGYWEADTNPFLPLMIVPCWGAEVRSFALGRQSVSFLNQASPTIVRPFFDANNRTESGVIVAFPGLATGSIAATAKMNLWGAETNVWSRMYHDDSPTTFGMWFVAGYRYLDLNSQIEIHQNTLYNRNLAQFPAFASFAGNRIQASELIATRNQFNGGQIGLSTRLFFECVIIESTFKLALGANRQEVHIEGIERRTAANGAITTSEGALLALPSNIGRFQRTKFSQVPEYEINFLFPVLSCLTLKLELNALYWNKIVRAREQIDRTIDITQIPNFPQAANATPTGLQQPFVPFRQSDLWMLGIGLGVQFSW